MTTTTPFASAADLWREVDGEPHLLDGLAVDGADPVLSSIFRVGAAAAGAVGATTLAVAATWHDRGGPVPEVFTDVREATTAFRSEQLLEIQGAAPNLWADLSGDYPGSDGWIRLHCNFAHHQAAALRALGLDPEADREQVAGAVAGRSSDAVVESVMAAGGCASELRPLAAWQTHPQGTTVASLPLVAIDPIGSAPPRPLREASRPLGGIRVLDLTRVIAGPVCGRVLASHGANVLRVGASHLPTFRVLDLDTGFGKRWCALDLRDAGDRTTFTTLARDADVVVQSYRPGALSGLGFGPEELAAVSPGVVVVSLSAYGQAGPWAPRRGFDSLVQLASGIAHEQAVAHGVARPVALPCQLLDHGTGWLAALGALAALRRRHREGGSWHVQVSLARTAAWLERHGRVEGIGTPAPGRAELSDLIVDDETHAGTLTHVRAVGTVSGTAPSWDRPPPAPGADPPAW